MLSTSSPNFKRELKTAREAMGLSGAELGRKAEITEGMISRYESETRADRVLPSPETLKKINEVLFGAAKIAATYGITGQASPSDQDIANSLPLPVLINAINRHGGTVTFTPTR